MKALTKKQQRAYVKGGGVHCPLCGGLIVTGDGRDYGDTDVLVQFVTCLDCGATFTETYKLADIDLRRD